MSRPLPSHSVWQVAYERRLLSLIAVGGVAVGLGVLAIGPPGFTGTGTLSLLALAIGVGAAASLLLGHTDPIPVLVLIVLLVGAIIPFVDMALAMALTGVVVGVVATGAVMIRRTQAVVALIALSLVAVALRPFLDMLGYLSAVPSSTPTVPWLVAMVAVLMTALGFRALRDQIVLKDAHQARVNELVSATASHIRNPLTAAMGFAYLLRSEVVDEQAAAYADGVIRRGWDANLGLDDLMIASRSDTGNLELLERPVDMATAVDRCLDQVWGARVKLREVSVTGSVLADPTRVRHILRHVVSNAVLHGGSEFSIEGCALGNRYEVRVKDNGAPLRDEERERVFEPFYRRPESESRAGRGVGLAVSRVLAGAMGGSLRLESGPDGNTAVLTLRAARLSDISPATATGFDQASLQSG